MSGFHETRDDAPWESAPGTRVGDLEIAAAAVELALLRRSAEPFSAMPAALAERIGRDAPAHLPRAITIESRPASSARDGRSGGRPWLTAAGWWTAACLVGLLWWQWSGTRRIEAPSDGQMESPSLAELRGRLLTEDPEAVTVAWKTAKDDPAVVASKADLQMAGGLGDVVWSPTRQQGFMRFRGLAANDPTVAQYQLWIFDAERNEAHPVDGGVFNVPAQADGEVVVRIDPRLPIGRATAFAITVERPGGVVVSSRERLPLLAALP